MTPIGRFKQMARLIEFPFGIIRRVTYVSCEQHAHPLNRHGAEIDSATRRENPRGESPLRSARSRLRQTRATFTRVESDPRHVDVFPTIEVKICNPWIPRFKLCASVNFTRTRALTSSALFFCSQVYSPPAPKLSQPRLASPTDPVPAYYLRVTPRDLDRAGSRTAGASPPP